MCESLIDGCVLNYWYKVFSLLGLGLKVPGHLANYSRGSQDWLNLLSHIERISIHAKLLFRLEQFGNLKICRCYSLCWKVPLIQCKSIYIVMKFNISEYNRWYDLNKFTQLAKFFTTVGRAGRAKYQLWAERDKVLHHGIGDESRARALWAKGCICEIREQ